MRIMRAGGEQIDAVGQREAVAMPVQHRHIDEMAQRAIKALIVHRDGMKAHFLDRAGIDMAAKRGRHHL